MTTPSATAPYVIPSAVHSGFSPFWLLPVSAIMFGLVAWLLGLNPGVAFITGFFSGIPMAMVAAVIVGTRASKRARAIWSKHDYAWYRASFPEHAHANGRVSCRHCGGTSVQARNMMNHTFMRIHACPQCGETLYFSPEKI